MFRRASEMHVSSTIASRSISAAEDLPGNFFVSENRYFIANHQHFGGVEKKFVIHRASPRDMRTKRGLGGEEGERMSKSPKAIADLFSANVRFLQIYHRLCTKCQSRKERLLRAIRSTAIGIRSRGRAVIGNEKICHERKKRGEAMMIFSIETFMLIARAINCNLSQKERRPRRADTIIDL